MSSTCQACMGNRATYVAMTTRVVPCRVCNGTGEREPCTTPDYGTQRPGTQPGGRRCTICHYREHNHPPPA